MIHACVVETGKGFYLLMDNDGAILSGKKERLLNYWTNGWTKGLDRGAGWHTGACLSFMQFRPSVISVPDLETLQAEIIGMREEYQLAQVSGTGGWFPGLMCDGPNVESAWESGERPTFFYDEPCMSQLASHAAQAAQKGGVDAVREFFGLD